MNDNTDNPLALLTPAQASDRVRYQLRHFDLMGSFPDAWGVAIRNRIRLTPADVSPELAAFIRGLLKNRHPHDNSSDPAHWRDIQPLTRTA